jgi:hypothetical protein
LIFVADDELQAVNGQFEGVNGIIQRPVVAQDLKNAIDKDVARRPLHPLWLTGEWRRRAID